MKKFFTFILVVIIIMALLKTCFPANEKKENQETSTTTQPTNTNNSSRSTASSSNSKSTDNSPTEKIPFVISKKATKSNLSSLGEVVRFGKYPKSDGGNPEPIEWIVIDTDGDKSLLITWYAIDCQPYTSEQGEISWETSSLREWLNHDFYEVAFTDEEKDSILNTYIDNSNRTYDGAGTTEDTYDNVFCLSIFEAAELLEGKLHYGYATELAISNGALTDRNDKSPWWYRTIGADHKTAYDSSTSKSYFNMVLDRDFSSINPRASNVSVRPAIWVDTNLFQ